MRSRCGKIRDERGFALFTVTLFILIQIVSGLAFYAMAFYETKGARYRQDSSEAFYLADGAIERARAKFLQDRTWRSGWNRVAAGRGSYDLAVVDTTVAGEDLVKLVSTGRVGASNRRIEVLAEIPPSASSITLFVGGAASATGNLCARGAIHINGTDNMSSHLTCGARLTRGFAVTPPPIYTDPDHFPATTYYYVAGYKSGSAYRAKIYDRYLNDVTATTTNLAGKVSYNTSTRTYTYSFTANNDVAKYFGDATGYFKRKPGDVAVVVNFAEPFTNPPDMKANVVFADNKAGATVTATIVNARFTGVTASDRTNPSFWTGGDLQVKQTVFAPRNGLAAVCFNLTRQGSAKVSMGTAAWPALVYVTRDVVAINAQFSLTGSAVVLRNWGSTGGPDLTFNNGFMERLPAYLRDDAVAGVSGTLKIARWREVRG